ncbi:hypothetical protein M3P05_10045 [Sansalvadorimonas sp. 2012CJ34-2]|uniref:Uncharacterized protein n=1 Tax=Parendozoicomonas callyspongiae TaxID=2942213 RepID=A0ABT0PHN4_9GAMM|nr:hypothetical protein [Sansalvadorimonas sp. 2012CJ34-2]MCL6270262.1 hypothetical protein [Sansalvadorimonas sp. 2012CJ34-2]
MSVALSHIRDMTLLQLASLHEDELARLLREANRSLGRADNDRKRLQNARYLRNLAQMKELTGELPADQGDEL